MLNERGVIADWLLKLIFGIAIAGVILYDAGSMLVNFFTLDSTANDVAIAISHSLATDEIRPTAQDVEKKALELAKESNVKLVVAEISRTGILRVELSRRASTVVVGRIGPIEDWAKATADAELGTS